MNHYLAMAIAGILGVFLHSLIKIRAINKRMPSMNYKGVFAAYWGSDWVSLLISITVVLAAIFISSEYLQLSDKEPQPGNFTELLQYKIASFLKTTFIVVGFCADSLVSAFLSVTEQKLKEKAKAGGVDPDQP